MGGSKCKNVLAKIYKSSTNKIILRHWSIHSNYLNTLEWMNMDTRSDWKLTKKKNVNFLSKSAAKAIAFEQEQFSSVVAANKLRLEICSVCKIWMVINRFEWEPIDFLYQASINQASFTFWHLSCHNQDCLNYVSPVLNMNYYAHK